MKVLKFGGSSLATAERIGNVVAIVRRARKTPGSVGVVVSAMGGVTDLLIETATLSARRGEGWKALCDQIETRHLEAAEQLAAEDERASLTARIHERIGELRDLLHGVFLVRECSARTLDQILSYGERLCAALVAAALRREGMEAEDCDARALILTDKAFGAAHVDLEASYELIRNHFGSHSALQILTGFLGATSEGETTTLGRGGSDYTAVLVAAALGAELVEIWTDVDGVMSADPRLVPSAFSLECLSYEELMELSHFGAKVVYPPTVHPARSQSIPLVIRNTLNPEFPGTRILERTESSRYPIRGISSIHRVALMRLEGDGMVGVPGTAKRLFEALAREEISVILISQASSEHSICFAVQPEVVERARARVDEEFLLERRAGLVDSLIVEGDLSVIAAVGEAMRERPGIAGRLFSVLGERGINVRAIAQGSSELNISLVVGRQDEARALNAIHDAFFATGVQVYLLGSGRVGNALREQIDRQVEGLARRHGLGLRVAGVCKRRRMVLDPRGVGASVDPDSDPRGTDTDLDTLVRGLRESGGSRVLVDCTANESVSSLYGRVLKMGVAVVTANKLPFTASTEEFRELMATRWAHGRGLYYETTVGAGLPVLRTLRDLIETGDKVERIEGVFSGTLSFLCHRLAEGRPFSAALREAQDAGYTEPDPREDLGGNDVARKLLILARESGSMLEPRDVEVEPFVPLGDRDAPIEDFWGRARSFDEALREQAAEAARTGKVLCYLARLDRGRATVALTTVAQGHPCANISGTDNLFAFYTRRYSESPLVVQGPGAGPAVTAAGVFADILRAVAESNGIGTP